MIAPVVVKPAWIQFAAPDVDADIDLIQPSDPIFDALVVALSEGFCPIPGCQSALAHVCRRATGEEWLVCPRGGWWLVVWP